MGVGGGGVKITVDVSLIFLGDVLTMQGVLQ